MSIRPNNLLFILPNLFTAASIFTGIYSIITALNGDFSKAAWLLFLALIFDGLDGRIARMTKTRKRRKK